MYQRIMVPLDGSELAECVLPHVEAIAKGCQAKEVVFVRVVENIELPTYVYSYVIPEDEKRRIQKEMKDSTEKYLKGVVARANYSGVKVRWQILEGPVAESLSDYTNQNKVDLIIIATHGHSGIGRWIIGSVADRVLRSACVPVFMVRAPGCKTGV